MTELSPALRVGVHGAAGHMGRLVVCAVLDASDLALGVATERAEHPRIGEDAGLIAGRGVCGCPLSVLDPRVAERVDVIIDFSLPEGTCALLEALPGVPLVTGTTGLDARVQAALARHARGAPVIAAPNFSRGVAFLARIAKEAAAALPDWDVEIVETHHRRKRDAPSGTALKLARAVAAGRGQPFEDQALFGRFGETGERPPGQIGIHALRGGDVVGEHTIRLFGAGEVLELGHTATSRVAFATGALEAARRVVTLEPGLHPF
jgi:4-hydroxy-tetrahydrodipicolinate reductase